MYMLLQLLLMKVNYWIEVLPPSASYQPITATAQALATAAPILRLYEQTWEDSPHWCRVDELIDAWEDEVDQLAAQGLAVDRATVWMRYESSEPEIELDIDPLTLARLGQAGLQLCIEGFHPLTDEATHWVPTQVQGCFAQPDDSTGFPVQRVEVWLDDHSVWEGFVTTQAALMGHWIRRQREALVASWQPSLLMLPSCEEDEIEQGVLALLRQGTFEQVFHQTEEPDQPNLPPQSGWRVNVLHDPAMGNPLQDHLTAEQAWYPSQPAEQHATLGQLLRDWAQVFPQLAGQGVLKRDVYFSWYEPYQGQPRQTLSPELMLSIGALGHHLHLNIFPQAQRVARYWEE